VLAALQHHHGLTPTPDADAPGIIHFAGTPTLTVVLKDVGTLGAGVERTEGDRRPQSTLLGMHAKRVLDEIGRSPAPRAAIFELEDDKYFTYVNSLTSISEVPGTISGRRADMVPYTPSLRSRESHRNAQRYALRRCAVNSIGGW
jgi:hypothetical protein